MPEQIKNIKQHLDRKNIMWDFKRIEPPSHQGMNLNGNANLTDSISHVKIELKQKNEGDKSGMAFDDQKNCRSKRCQVYKAKI